VLVWKPYYMDKLFSPASYTNKKELIFAYELHRARWQRCGDPRDHIFSLLGHPAAVDKATGKRWVEADYTKSLEDVYHELAVRLLVVGNELMMLNVVQHESLEKGKYYLKADIALKSKREAQTANQTSSRSTSTRYPYLGPPMGRPVRSAQSLRRRRLRLQSHAKPAPQINIHRLQPHPPIPRRHHLYHLLPVPNPRGARLLHHFPDTSVPLGLSARVTHSQ
jgi:hypothetical protein